MRLYSILKQVQELGLRQAGLLDDLLQSCARDILSSMKRNCDALSGCHLFHNDVATSLSGLDKTRAFERSENLLCLERAKPPHVVSDTLTFAVSKSPALSVGTGFRFDDFQSRYNKIASWILSNASPRFSPQETHPGRAGTLTV